VATTKNGRPPRFDREVGFGIHAPLGSGRIEAAAGASGSTHID